MLTERMKKFCYEYLIDLNATQAAIRSGYSPTSAQMMSSETLSKPIVQEYLAHLKAELAKKTLVTPEYVVDTLKEVVERSLQHKGVLDNDGNLIGEYKYDSAGVNKAVELLGKTLGLFVEKKQIDGQLSVTQQLLDEIVDDEDEE